VSEYIRDEPDGSFNGNPGRAAKCL